MKLAPAVKIGSAIYQGTIRDSHVTIAEAKGLPTPTEEQRGFSPDGKMFLTRKQALGWLKSNDIKTFRKLPGAAHYAPYLHSHQLAKAYGVTQNEENTTTETEDTYQEPTPIKVDISTKSVLVIDRGLHTYCAEELAKKYKKVYFYLSEEDPYPNSAKASIGSGLKGVTRVDDMWDYVDKVDLICFFDTNYGSLAHYLRQHGYLVFGSGKGENVELDKIGFLETLEKLNLPCPLTYLAEGIDDALDYISKHKDETLFLKSNRRGDFESKKYTSIPQITTFFDEVKKRIGSAADKVEILIQHKIDSEVEAGIDGFCIDGKYTANSIIGIEGKDVCFAGQIFEQNPAILQQINDAFSPEFKRLGYRGNYSTEIRIDKNSTPWFIDPTPRQPEPPGALMTQIYTNWAESVWHIAGGEVPVLEYDHKFGAQFILTSWWYNEHELHVSIPDKYKKHLQLKNHKIVDGEIYVVPNQNGEYFGSITATGNTIQEAIDKIKEVADSIEADGFKFDKSCFDNILESCSKARKFGIDFEMDK